MKIRTTHKIGQHTYISKTWNTNNGILKNILLSILYIYYFIFLCLWIPIKWIINKIKNKEEN